MRAPGHTRYRSASFSILVLVCMLGDVIVGGSMAWQPGTQHASVGMRVTGLVLVVACLPLVIRGLQAGVARTRDGVVVRKLLVTYHLSWDEFISAAASRTAGLVPWWILIIERRSGKPIKVPEISNLGVRGRRRLVDAVVRDLNGGRPIVRT